MHNPSHKLSLLYLDDETINLDGFYFAFNDFFNIYRAQNAKQAFQILESRPIKVVITDQRMPDMLGTEFIQKAKEKNSELIFIIISAYAEQKILTETVKNLKVYGLIQKPYKEQEMLMLVKNAFEAHKLQANNIKLIEILRQKNKELEAFKISLEKENILLKEELKNQLSSEIITQNATFQELLLNIEKAATSDAPVLIEGKTGTGKELIAKAIHEISNRSQQPLITVNCAALPDTLIESELFGYEKGAFTGAIKQKPGRFEIANNATLFLDEIGELPLHIQPKLLRVLQQGEFERIGGNETIKTNVRIIAATNRNLNHEIKTGNFREDLFFRLSVFIFQIPPLNERPDDISLLTYYFINKFNKKYSKTISIVPKQTLKKLEKYEWPGNVRELENIIERAVITSPAKTLSIDSLNLQNEFEDNVLLTLEEVERYHIEKTLKKTKGRIRGKGGAAEILDIKPTTLHSRIKKLEIKK